MRILQVVTYISPDGAYGGPVRVAINQAKALTALGHEVVVAASAGGFEGPLPHEFDGFPVRLFPAYRTLRNSGFAGLISPRLLKWLHVTIKDFDVLHVHLARDLVTLPAAALALRVKKPLVVQTHGMIDRTEKKLAGPLDRYLTRPVLHGAQTVFYLTDRERQDLTEVAGDTLSLKYIPNGVEVPPITAIEQRQNLQPDPEVLFLARLHSIKRPSLMVEAARKLGAAYPTVRFTLIGPDEGEASQVKKLVQKFNQDDRVNWAGPLPPEQTLARMSQSSMYVLPSSAEVFPMSVLEAMSLGLPVVVTDGCGLAPMIKERSAGMVCGQSPDDFIGKIELLLRHPEHRVTMGSNARRAIKDKYSLHQIAENLVDAYEATFAHKELKA